MKKVQEKKVSDFLTVRNDRFKPNEAESLGLKRIDKIDFSGNIYLSDKPTNTDMILARKGDLVISGINAAKGALAIYHGEEDVLATIHYSSYQFDEKKINIDYLQNFVKSPVFQHTLKQQVKGGMKTELKPKHILNLEIPLPSLAEQETIVQKIKGFMATHSQAKAQIEALQTDLKAYRKSILQEAIKGNLTEAWRANNPTEKIDLKTLKKESIKKQKPLPPTKADEMPFELPQNWEWVRLGEICSQITDGTHQTPTYVTKGRIFLSAQNIKPFRFMPENHRFVSEDAYQGYISNRKAELGDVFVARVGAGIGEAAVIDQEIDFAFYVSLGLIKHYREALNSYYLVTLFNSPYGVGYSKGNISSNGFAGNFNLERIRAFTIPLPPLTEQAEIVRVLEEKMATIVAAEEQLKVLLAEQSQLQKSMMQEVFRG